MSAEAAAENKGVLFVRVATLSDNKAAIGWTGSCLLVLAAVISRLQNKKSPSCARAMTDRCNIEAPYLFIFFYLLILFLFFSLVDVCRAIANLRAQFNRWRDLGSRLKELGKTEGAREVRGAREINKKRFGLQTQRFFSLSVVRFSQPPSM